uniref:Nicotinamide-nucleotide adenylyltransferase n=1 Tax=Ascaris lumbricoides TaxID=6252 RepID=A0A0M3HW69_ASCLU
MSSLEGARVALLACGSYNPPTVMHLRMFEAARSFLESRYDCNVVEGIISPVADSFAKPGLLPACNRMQMAELAVKSSTWIHADSWECSQKQWTRTICVLKHFKDVLDKKFDIGARVRLMLLCGGDVVDTFSVITPKGTKLWDPADLLEIVRDFGLVVLSRHNSKPMETLQTLPFLDGFRSNVYVFDDDVMPNEVSSTRVRNAIRCGKSVKYCIEDSVLEYIREHHLYATTTSPKPPTSQPAISGDNTDERHKSFDDEYANRNI